MAKKAKKQKTGLGRRFIIRADDEFFSVLDDWRRKQQDLPTRAAAMRRLVMATKKK